jgi:hypothetical protein
MHNPTYLGKPILTGGKMKTFGKAREITVKAAANVRKIREIGARNAATGKTGFATDAFAQSGRDAKAKKEGK